MRKMILYLLISLFIGCAQSQLSHTDTAKIVVESFYLNDNSKLKKHTTPDSYASFMAVQSVVAPEGSSNKISNFKVLQETVDGDVSWVKFSTDYEEKAETFKLTNQGGKWLVMEKGLREKEPF